MDDFSTIVAAGPAFFVSAWLPMIFAGIAGAEVGMTISKPRRAPGETLAASGAGRELTQPGSVMASRHVPPSTARCLCSLKTTTKACRRAGRRRRQWAAREV